MANRIQTLENLRARRNPDGLLKEAYASIQEDDSVQYLLGAMEPVEASFTKKTYEEGERVAKQISSGLAIERLNAEYEYQGSVTKNTHIKAYSDIDLLVLEMRFYSIEPPQPAPNPYNGNPVTDLFQIRRICITHLRSAFPTAKVDDSGSKSVKLSGGSLVRTVDIVPANWYDTNEYALRRLKHLRGVHVLDSHKMERISDQPFLHGAYIDHKDHKTQGSTKKLIRLLKTLKYDSENKDAMSSYDIESIVYQMNDTQMQKPRGEEIPLAHACWIWLKMIEDNQQLRSELSVPDGKRKIFAEGKATLSQLKALRNELEGLLRDIDLGLRCSKRKLAEAKVRWPS